MTRKRRLASSALWPMGDTEDDASRLQKMLASGDVLANGDPVYAAVSAMFDRDGSPIPKVNPDGSMTYH